MSIPQIIIPIIGSHGHNGTLNGLGTSGAVFHFDATDFCFAGHFFPLGSSGVCFFCVGVGTLGALGAFAVGA